MDPLVHQTVLRNWVKGFADNPQQAFPGHGQEKSESGENAEVKREVAKLDLNLSHGLVLPIGLQNTSSQLF